MTLPSSKVICVVKVCICNVIFPFHLDKESLTGYLFVNIHNGKGFTRNSGMHFFSLLRIISYKSGSYEHF